MKTKKFLASILAGITAFGIYFADAEVSAASREEIATIQIQKGGSNFKYWEKNSAPLSTLKSYVKDVTDKRSKNFIPVEDRIAVFDMDGTFYCETAPTYSVYMFVLYTILEDPPEKVSDELREEAKVWRESLLSKGITPEVAAGIGRCSWTIFEDMTDEEYYSRVKKFMTTQNVVGLSNLKYGEGFYLPMVEIISYLDANDFTIYIITGTERNMTRILTEDVLPVKKNHIIGYDIPYKWDNSGGEKYFAEGDRILMGISQEEGSHSNHTHIKKIFSIKREIGKQPVLAFGNSKGDYDMLNYTTIGNKYKSAAFIVLCDDIERELGNLPKAENEKALAKKHGWNTISMHDDFKTIYGDNVKKI